MRRFKYFLVAALLIVLLPITKNFIMFFTYNNDVEMLEETGHTNVYKEYTGIIKSHEDGFDFKYESTIRFNNDSSGIFKSKRYDLKINNKRTSQYSFGSLLPFKNEFKEYEFEFWWDKKAIYSFRRDSTEKAGYILKYYYIILDNKLYFDIYYYRDRPAIVQLLKFWEM